MSFNAVREELVARTQRKLLLVTCSLASVTSINSLTDVDVSGAQYLPLKI